jgi:signal transduction histidine kinase
MTQLRRLRSITVVVLAVVLEMAVLDGDRWLRGGGVVPLWLVLGFMIPVFSTLVLRWRYPVAVFAGQWVFALAGVILPGYEPFAGLLVALHAVACRVSTRGTVILLIGCSIPFGINTYNNGVQSGGTLADFLIPALLWTVLSVAGAGFGWHSRFTDDQGRQLLQQREALAARALHAERLQLARELHDIVANAVTAMLLQAAGAGTLIGIRDDQVRQSLTAIENTGIQAMGELHRLLALLRAENPGAGDMPRVHDQPGLNDIPALLELHRATGLEIDLTTEGNLSAGLDPSVALAAYRVVQEALTNSSKYAGARARIAIQQTWHEDHLTLTIQDTPEHPAAQTLSPAALSSGYGLRGLTERVTLIGGQLDAGPTVSGFTVRAALPTSSQAAPVNRDQS